MVPGRTRLAGLALRGTHTTTNGTKTMRVTISFHTDNEAFHTSDDYQEFERVMEDLKVSIGHNSSGSIRDINGNTIGEWSWS